MTYLIRTLQLAIVGLSVALAVVIAPQREATASAPHPQATPCWVGCHAEPSGRIGHPSTGRNPRHTHKPPKEPRLTMPPTDTAGSAQ